MTDLATIWAFFGPSVHYLSRPLDGPGLAFGQARSLDVLSRLAGSLAPWHVWFCLNPSYSLRPKPTKEEIAAVKWLVLDQDSDTFAGGAQLGDLCCELNAPYIRTYTGRGRQALIRVESTGDLLLDDRIIKGLTQRWSTTVPDIDSSCAEISRVVRLPGTTNPKNGRPCRIERLEEDGQPLRLLDYRDLAVSAPAPAASGGQEALTGSIALSTLGVTAWNTWLLGPRTGTRHKELWHLTKSCKEIGLDAADTRLAVGQANEKCEKPLTGAECSRIVRQLFPGL